MSACSPAKPYRRGYITPHYLRLSFDACGMLQASPLHPLGRGGPHFVRPDLSAAAGMLASKPVIN
jgi:hypothetical protein